MPITAPRNVPLYRDGQPQRGLYICDRCGDGIVTIGFDRSQLGGHGPGRCRVLPKLDDDLSKQAFRILIESEDGGH